MKKDRSVTIPKEYQVQEDRSGEIQKQESAITTANYRINSDDACCFSHKRLKPMAEPKGTATVEAAIILPLVMLAILSILSIIRITGTYERMQHALNQVAEDLSQYSYLYAISGLKEQHDTLSDNIGEAKEELLQQQEAVSTFYESIQSVSGDITDLGNADKSALNKLFDSLKDLNNAGVSYEELSGQVENILQDPMGEVRLVSLALSDTLFSKTKTALLGVISKSMLEDRLCNDLNIPARELPERLRMTDGIQELDFSCSTFFDDNETIDLIVEYTVRPMPDFFFLPEIRLRNRSCVLAWTWGVDRETDKTDPENSSDNTIWNIDKGKNSTIQHFGRGNTAESLFAKELTEKLGNNARTTPYHFKTVDIIDYSQDQKDGSLISVFSLNPFLPTYQKESAVTGEIKQKLYQLKEFTRYETKNYFIDTALLTGNYKRTVYIVVPENKELPGVYLKAFGECMDIARKLGVELIQVQKYGEYEKTEDKPQDSSEEKAQSIT